MLRITDIHENLHVHDTYLMNIDLKLNALFREDFIDKTMEESVSNMQAVIELGRVVRDRRTMPIKVTLQLDLLFKSYNKPYDQ